MSATDQKIVVPGLTDPVQGLLTGLHDQLRAKQRRNLLRMGYYDGKHAAAQVGTIIPPQYKKLAIVLGWSAKAVDILARRCNIDDVVWPDGDLTSLGFSDVWDANHLGSELSSGIVTSLIHGVSFLINGQGAAPDEPDSLIHVKDPLNGTGTWNPRSRRLDAFLSVTSRDGEGEVDALSVYLPNLIVNCLRTDGKWAVESRVEHRYGVPVEPLVYKPRAGRPFGTSRISRPVMSLHDQALRTVIRMEGHADVYSFPEMWLLGADSSIFKNPDGTMKPSWQVMLGRIKAVPDDDGAAQPRADVKQFSASSPQPHIDQLKQQAQLFSGETSIPLTSLGVSDMSNPTSAESYLASREDLIAEAEGATDDWSPPLRRCFARALAIQNGLDGVPAAWQSIAPKWRSPIHLSRAAQADAGTKQLAAVPWLADTQVGLELLGLSDQQIRLAMSQRRRAEGRQAIADIRDAALAAVSADADGV